MRIFLKERLCAKFFKKRFEILRSLRCTQTTTSEYANDYGTPLCNISQVNSVCNVTDLALELFADVPSYTLKYSCNECNLSTIDASILARIHLQKIVDSGLSSLIDALDFRNDFRKECCGRSMISTQSYNPHLLISVDTGLYRVTPISDISDTVIVPGGPAYKMAGFVAYYGDYENTSIGHYTAFVKVGCQWIKYDDTSTNKSPERVDESTTVDPQLLFYTKIDESKC